MWGAFFEADYDTLDLLDPELIIYGNRFGAWDENAGESVNNLKERYPDADLLFYQVRGIPLPKMSAAIAKPWPLFSRKQKTKFYLSFKRWRRALTMSRKPSQETKLFS